jgi:GGDEF domain-containing protein
MRETVKKRLLKNLLVEVSRRYEALLEQNRLIYEKTAYKAVHDNLTGLYNRAYLMEILESLSWLISSCLTLLSISFVGVAALISRILTFLFCDIKSTNW